MAIKVTDNYFRNAFSSGAKPRVLIEIGRSWSSSRGCFEYPTFFRNFCYGGNLRVHNIHVEELNEPGTATDDNHGTTAFAGGDVNGETIPRFISLDTNDALNTGSLPHGVFTRGDTVEFIDGSSTVGESFIVNGNNTPITSDLYQNSFGFKSVDELSNSTGYSYRLHRDYFDEVTNPPNFQNSINRLGGLASSGSITFSLANIKQEGVRKNWNQSNTNSAYTDYTQLSKYWSQFMYNQEGDMLDNIENVADDWGVEGSGIKVYLVYCEDTIYRGTGKINVTSEYFESVDPAYRWTYYGDATWNLQSDDTLILHNKISDGSVDANCRSYTIAKNDNNKINVSPDFPTGSTNDTYYYSIKRSDHMTWDDFHNGKVLMFDGVISGIPNITQKDITFAAESRALQDLNKSTFGWEKVDSSEKSHGINNHLFSQSDSIGIENGMEASATESVIPIFFGDARLLCAQASPLNATLLDLWIDTHSDLSLGDFSKQGVVGGISNYVTPIKICEKICTQDLAFKNTHGTGWTDFQQGGDPHPLILENYNERRAKLKAFLVSKYPLYSDESYYDHALEYCPFQFYPSRKSGGLTVNSGGVRGMLMPQRFRGNDNVQGTLVWAHTEDYREDEDVEGASGSFSLTGIWNEIKTDSYDAGNTQYHQIYLDIDPSSQLFKGDYIEISENQIHNCSLGYVRTVWTAGDGPHTAVVELQYGTANAGSITCTAIDGGPNTGQSTPTAGDGLLQGTTMVHVIAITKIEMYSSTQLKYKLSTNGPDHGYSIGDYADVFAAVDGQGADDATIERGEVVLVDVDSENNIVIAHENASGFSTSGGSTTAVAYVSQGGCSTGKWTKMNEWVNVWDNPKVRWVLLPTTEPTTNSSWYVYHDGTNDNQNGGTAEKVLDWASDPNLSDSISTYVTGDYDSTGAGTAQKCLYTTWSMQGMPNVKFNRHYFMRHWEMNPVMPDADKFGVFLSTFVAKSTASDYEGWDEAGGSYPGGLVYCYKPGYPAPNTNGIVQSWEYISATHDYPLTSGIDKYDGHLKYFEGKYISTLPNAVSIGMRTDYSGSAPVNEGNIDPKLYIYLLKLHLDSYGRIDEKSIVYNGWGSPVGSWCFGRTIAAGFDEEHADELASRTNADWPGGNGEVASTGDLDTAVFGSNTYGQEFERHNRFKDAENPFSSVVTGDLLVFNPDTNTSAARSSSVLKSTPSGTGMSGQNSSGNQLARGEFMINYKIGNGELALFDPEEKTKFSGSATTHWGSLLSISETIGKFPATDYNHTTGADNNITGIEYMVLEGKACLNPMTQIEQLLRWELFWDDTAIDENSFNTASNLRSSWEGQVLIESEVGVAGYVDSFFRSMGTAAWLGAGGKMKVLCHEDAGLYSATKQNNVLSSMTSTNQNGATEALNLCTNEPHLGWGFDFDSKYQSDSDEMRNIRIVETTGSKVINVVMEEADNTIDPITAASKLESRIQTASTAQSGYGTDWKVRFNWATQKFILDAGSGNVIKSFGVDGNANENTHDSVVSQYGFYKYFQTVGTQTFKSHFPVSSLPLYGHMIVKESLSASKTQLSSIENDITIKYIANRSVNVTDAESIDKYGARTASYTTLNIADETTATNYANYILGRNANSKITVNFDIAGASGIVFEVWDIIAVSHELLKSFFGKEYNSHVADDINSNTKFKVLTTSYKSKSNSTSITAEEV